MGRPDVAPLGIFAVTLRLWVEAGVTLSFPPSLALKSTLLTSLKWRPVSWIVESVVALCMPPQVSTQTASLTSGGTAGAMPPPEADAKPAPMERHATPTAAAAAAVRPRRLGALVRALKLLSLSGLRG